MFRNVSLVLPLLALLRSHTLMISTGSLESIKFKVQGSGFRSLTNGTKIGHIYLIVRTDDHGNIAYSIDDHQTMQPGVAIGSPDVCQWCGIDKRRQYCLGYAFESVLYDAVAGNALLERKGHF